MNIIKDFSKIKAVNTSTFSEGEPEQLAYQIQLAMQKEGTGVGLAANQLDGVNPKRLCVININDEPYYLVNPRIVDQSEDKFTYFESCLSIPKTRKRPVKTERYMWVKVEADNLPEGHVFEPDNPKSWNEDPMNFWKDIGFLESVCVQHQIDTLDGISIKDRSYSTTHVNEKKYGRNEQVMFMNPTSKDVEFLKYKYGHHLLEEGWVIV